jgi:hypothetical protein
MRFSFIIVAGLSLISFATTSITTQARAEEGGCLKYGAAGAVAGHAVHHGVKGAAIGCAAGMVVRHHARKSARARAKAAADAGASGLKPHDGSMPREPVSGDSPATGQQPGMAPR